MTLQRRRQRGGVGLLVAVVVGTLAGGCGSGIAKPTSVAPADLDRSGSFWLSLTDDLKQTLTGDCQERLAHERPEGASEIEAVPPRQLIQRIDVQYENSAKRANSIFATCVGANDELAGEKLRSLEPALEAQSEGE